MSILERSVRVGHLWDYLAGQGFVVEETTDLAVVDEIARAASKPYVTPMSSSAWNDFTEDSQICLVARRKGEPVMFGCARLESLGDEPVHSYWQRVFSRSYGGQAGEPVIGDFDPAISVQIGGRLVYFGDLFVAQSVRGSRLCVRAFVAIGHLIVSQKWNPDFTYCFIREPDVMRGAAALYGFSWVPGAPFQWLGEPPAPRDKSEVLAALPRRDLMRMTARVHEAVADRAPSCDAVSSSDK